MQPGECRCIHCGKWGNTIPPATEALIDMMLSALQDLYDEQNGHPLVRYAPAWERAMYGATKAIAAARKHKGLST